MTQQIIPFISQLALNEQVEWIERLNGFLDLQDTNISIDIKSITESTNTKSITENGDYHIANYKVVLAATLSSSEKLKCKIAIVANPEPEVLADFPKLIWIQSLWAGVERLIAEIPSPSFEIVRLVDPCLAKTMAEAVVAWSYYLHRDMPLYMSQQRSQQWQQHEVTLSNDRTVGILGLGELGQASADKLALNGFNVLGWSQQQKALEGISCFNGLDGLNHVISQSDIIVVLLPLTEKTTGLLNRDLFSKMKSGAGIINFARGKIIDHADLVAALNEKIISHAVLDVFVQEPLPEDNSLWQHPNITVLPHISAPTNRDTACKIVIDNIKNYFLTGNIPASVDFKKGY
ncbi:MAG: glyoxylate/hydroxypyruvate reductase A [Thalassotalea sp.]|nr:glyoxylate/hydroxypyruvate reductase A [Thalassotalea sp.]